VKTQNIATIYLVQFPDVEKGGSEKEGQGETQTENKNVETVAKR
jgi:hypothetical protein